MSITVRGTIYAAPTAPGYAVGKRVLVTAVIEFTAPQIAAIDAAAGAALEVASVPVLSVNYILTDGTNYDANVPGALTATVQVAAVERGRKDTGYRNFTFDLGDQSGASYHTGNVRMAGYATIGSVFSASPPAVTPVDPTSGPGTGLSGSWYQGPDFGGTPGFTGLERVNFAARSAEGITATGTTPHTGFNIESSPQPDLSVRWRGKIKFPAAGNWRLRWHTTGQGGVWIDGVKVIDHPTYQTTYLREVPYTPWMTVALDEAREIRIDWRRSPTWGLCILYWEGPGQALEIVPLASLYAFATPADQPSVTATNTPSAYIETVNRYEES